MNLAKALSNATYEPTPKPKKKKPRRKEKRIHIQAQKYHLVPQWRRRRP